MTVSARLKSFLDENKISYSVVSHAPAYTAQAAAAVMHISGKEIVKTVVVRAGEDTALAVLPASHHVNLEKLGLLLGKPVRLATEKEFADLFPDCELGAMPPVGQLYNLPVLVDKSLAEDEEIVFNAGTHRDAIRMRFEEFVRIEKPRVSAFGEKPGVSVAA